MLVRPIKYLLIIIILNISHLLVTVLLFHFCFISISVEGGVGVSVWSLEDGNLLGLVGDWLTLELDEVLGSWP